MSLEFLSYPHMHMFFEDDADRYRTGHLEDALLFLPYGCAVDEFQHRVYENPEMSPEERAELWQELEATYLPHRKYDGMSHHESGRLWQQQRHIFAMPFYYIDYCLAQTCALQMWHAAEHDREGTMARYRELCQLGGSLPFTGLLKAVGLSNPFQGRLPERCMDSCCADARTVMSLLLLALLGACTSAEGDDFARPTGPMGVTDGPSDGSEDKDTGDTGSTD